MDPIFNSLSFQMSKNVTTAYSTSFSTAVNMLAPSLRPAIHSIYGFVRFADEIVDSFIGSNQSYLIEKFESDYHEAYEEGISLNPILNAFQLTVKEYSIDQHLIDSFLQSMKMDLVKRDYESIEDYNSYIYGSADVVGLMCLKVFVNGDEQLYNKLKDSAMRLGSAFQKVNFLRDLKNDTEILNRSYFPHIDLAKLDKDSKNAIILEIEEDFKLAFEGIKQLPKSSKFGVYTAFVYYRQLLKKLKATPSHQIIKSRIRVKDHVKFGLMLRSYFNVKLNLLS